MKKKGVSDVDILGILLKRGKISQQAYEAGQRFADDFVDAKCMGVSAVDYEQMANSGSCGTNRMSATERTVCNAQSVQRAINALGGMGSPWGCHWVGDTCHPVGCWAGIRQNGRQRHFDCRSEYPREALWIHLKLNCDCRKVQLVVNFFRMLEQVNQLYVGLFVCKRHQKLYCYCRKVHFIVIFIHMLEQDNQSPIDLVSATPKIFKGKIY